MSTTSITKRFIDNLIKSHGMKIEKYRKNKHHVYSIKNNKGFTFSLVCPGSPQNVDEQYRQVKSRIKKGALQEFNS